MTVPPADPNNRLIDWYRTGTGEQPTDQRFLVDSSFTYPKKNGTESHTRFKSELNDDSNTVRHFMASLVFTYKYGDALGNIAGWSRDSEVNQSRDCELAYEASDLGEDLADFANWGRAWGTNLQDFLFAFLDSVCDRDTANRYKNRRWVKYVIKNSPGVNIIP